MPFQSYQKKSLSKNLFLINQIKKKLVCFSFFTICRDFYQRLIQDYWNSIQRITNSIIFIWLPGFVQWQLQPFFYLFLEFNRRQIQNNINPLQTLILNMNDCAQQKFAFQYHLDLGEQNVAKIVINQDSDPYVEASKFCAKYNLKSIYITIIGDAIAAQMLIEKQQKKFEKAEKCHQSSFHVISDKKCETLESNTMQTELKQQAEGGAEFSFQRSGSSTQLKKREVGRNSNIFDSLYNNHKQIEMKKEMIRKRSFDAIPFRPKINRLSQKIVEKKRSLGAKDSNLTSSGLATKQSSLEKGTVLAYSMSKVSNREQQRGWKENKTAEQKGKKCVKEFMAAFKRQLPQEIMGKLNEHRKYQRNHCFR